MAAIDVGTPEDRTSIKVDEELTTWLNTIEASGSSIPPTPSNESWLPFTMPSDSPTVVFDPGASTTFDVLEILSYPGGLDLNGEPVSVEIHPLCGPQAEQSCSDASWGTNGVQIPYETVASAIDNTEYYAIGGILLPDGDSHPDSFMALMRRGDS